jgi:hypothetical protein
MEDHIMQVRHIGTRLRVRLFLILLAIAGGVALGLFSNSSVKRAAAQQSEDRIAFTRDGQILTVKPDGTGLIPIGQGHDPSWKITETGQGKIAFTYGPSHLTRIAVMNEDGTNFVDVTPPNLETRTSQPDLSPGATRIAFVNEVLETNPGEAPQVALTTLYSGRKWPELPATLHGRFSLEFRP